MAGATVGRADEDRYAALTEVNLPGPQASGQPLPTSSRIMDN
jgi:hypothetical protein